MIDLQHDFVLHVIKDALKEILALCRNSIRQPLFQIEVAFVGY